MGRLKDYPEYIITSFDENEYNRIDDKFGYKISTISILKNSYGYLKPIKLVKIQLRKVKNKRNKVKARNIRIFECICTRCGNTCLANERSLREKGKHSCGCLERDTREKLKRDHIKDITGWKIDMLTAKYRVNTKNDKNYGKWYFECECGRGLFTTKSRLITGKRKHPYSILSCGCMTSQMRSAGVIRSHNSHGMYNTNLYAVYQAMISRCYKPYNQRYSNYGGRGITVCDEWLGDNGFIAFKDWAYANGYYDQPKDTPRKDRLTIDRIDNDGPYAPWNCRWVTNKVQSNNKSTNRHIRYNGEIYTFSQFRNLFGIKDQVYMHEYVNKHREGKSLDLMVWNFIHFNEPNKRLYYDKKRGMYVDKNGFIHLLPKYDIKLID